MDRTAGSNETPIRFGTDGWRAIIAEEFTFQNVRACAQATALYIRETGLAASGKKLPVTPRSVSAQCS